MKLIYFLNNAKGLLDHRFDLKNKILNKRKIQIERKIQEIHTNKIPCSHEQIIYFSDVFFCLLLFLWNGCRETYKKNSRRKTKRKKISPFNNAIIYGSVQCRIIVKSCLIFNMRAIGCLTIILFDTMK